MKLRQAVPAGLVDVGAIAVAAFAVQIYAARYLNAEELGAYALFFAAYAFGLLLPRYLFFQPVEIEALNWPATERIQLLNSSLKYSLALPFLALAPAGISVLAVAFAVPSSTWLPILVTQLLVAVLFPIHDHIRRMLHTGNDSWSAAWVSLAQVPAVAVALLVLSVLSVSPVWIPFGSLALAQLASVVIAGVLVIRKISFGIGRAFQLSRLMATGRWLLLGGLSSPAAGFVAAGLLTVLASSESLGYAEAARVVARPTSVLAVGFMAAMSPRIMEAARAGDTAKRRVHFRLYLAVVLTLVVPYSLVTGGDWSLNPAASFLPNAYEEPGLAALTLVAAIAFILPAVQRWELIGRGRERLVAAIDAIGAMSMVLVASASPVLGSYAIPLGVLSFSLIAGAGYWKYAGSSSTSSDHYQWRRDTSEVE